jgi:1,4-alpha-glucan branching enzyme
MGRTEGYFALVLHAHLPYVRHPEHTRFLEENWLFEAVTESYLPLLQRLEEWRRLGMEARLTLTLTPTLCSMLLDPLLQDRCSRYIDALIDLAEKEVHRTQWLPAFHPLARMYLERFQKVAESYRNHGRDLVSAFGSFQRSGQVEIITSAATHAMLPLMENHPPSIRAQILVARDHYRGCFGCEPRGIWLPECAYVPGVESALQEANLRWFITEAHGLLHAQPSPRYGLFAPVFAPSGLAVFGRDVQSARQVWSKHEGYPGDPNYRDFYRDIGYDLDYDYLEPYMPAPPHRSFTGLKYHAITGPTADKREYSRETAIRTADAHARHFLEERLRQVKELAAIMDRPPIIVCPYDAELFGHWWYEGPEFLDFFFRKVCYDQDKLKLITPGAYLSEHRTNQVSRPSASSWGEGGYWKVWLNEKNEWIHRHLQVAQERMTGLARKYPEASGLAERALKQAGRELLLAQASDWPFILRADSSSQYAVKKIKDHLVRFHALHEQLTVTRIDEGWLARIEWQDNIFPEIDHRYWA